MVCSPASPYPRACISAVSALVNIARAIESIDIFAAATDGSLTRGLVGILTRLPAVRAKACEACAERAETDL